MTTGLDRARDALRDVGQLAAQPQVLVQLLYALEEDGSAADLESIMRADHALSAAALRMANSAAMGGVCKVANLTDAIARLGRQNLQRIVVSLQASRMLAGCGRGYGLGPGELWAGSVAGALAAQWLAHARLTVDPALAYITGLLRDMGKGVMEVLVPVSDLQSCLRNVAEGQPSWIAERQEFGFDHAQLGAALAEAWHLPPPIGYAIGSHHDLDDGDPDAGDCPLAMLVRAGDLVARQRGWGVGLEGPVREPELAGLQALALEARELDACIADMESELRQLLHEFGSPA